VTVYIYVDIYIAVYVSIYIHRVFILVDMRRKRAANASTAFDSVQSA
jgi:hypothetical protein